MKYVTGMIGVRVHTVVIDHGTVQCDASIAHALIDLANKSDEAILSQCRLLFGDTMQVSDSAPQPVAAPAPDAGQVVNATQVQPPAAPGSVPMAEPAAAEAKGEDAEPPFRGRRG